MEEGLIRQHYGNVIRCQGNVITTLLAHLNPADPIEKRRRDVVDLLRRLFALAWDAGHADVAAVVAAVAAEVYEIAGIRAARPTGEPMPGDPRRSAWMFGCFVFGMTTQVGNLTATQAAGFLGCSDRHVRRLAKRGLLTARIGPSGAWICNASSVTSYRRTRR